MKDIQPGNRRAEASPKLTVHGNSDDINEGNRLWQQNVNFRDLTHARLAGKLAFV